MKKLRLFDSLKLVLATVACTFILNVAHADTSINSVIAYGKTEQSATPTPTTPVPIMTNNGVLKVRPNLLDPSFMDNSTYQTVIVNGVTVDYAKILPTENGKTYTLSAKITATGGYYYYLKKILPDGTAQTVQMWYNTSSSSVSNKTYTFTTSDNAVYVVYFAHGVSVATLENFRLEEGSTATTGIYVDGLTETIRDSAGHTARAQMLLGLNDEYRDEQNINTGAITRKVGVKVFDGTENWTKTGSGTNYTKFGTSDIISAKGGNESIGYSTHLVCSYANISGNFYWSAGPNNLQVIMTNEMTVEEFKAYLADQYNAGTPVIVVYPLATETTENVATQTMTTVPVRQTAGSILGMPIEVVFGDGTREWVSEMITIATTKYNEESFAPVKTDLSAAVNAVEYVVSNTMSQAQAIDTIATTKQTRPDEGCMAKYCLLVEDEDGTPHWYPIAGANGVEYVLPAGYTQLEYLQSDGRSQIIVPYRVNNKTVFYAKYSLATSQTVGIIFGITDAVSANVANNGILRMVGTYNRMGWGNNVSGSVIDVNAPQNLDTWYEVLYDQNKLYQDNVLYATSATSNDTEWVANYDLGIFARNGPAGNTYPAIAKISSVWAKENGVYKINLVPARRDSDGVLGMYDLADANPATAFYTNAGTGEFTAGPDM